MLSPTLVTVILTASLIGAVAGVLGSFLVLRGQSLLGDVIAHAALPGIVGGFLLSGNKGFLVILTGALVSGALAGLSVQLLRRGAGIKPDAALATVLSLFFAAGIVLLSFAQLRPNSAGLTVFLFGQAASVLRADLVPLMVVSAVVLLTIALLWKEFVLVTFDRDAAQTMGLPVQALETVLTILFAISIVIGLSLAGVVLMVALLIAPAVAARQWVERIGPMVLLAMAFGIGAGTVGAWLSSVGPGLATGPVMVLCASSIAVISILFAPARGVVPRWARLLKARRTLEERQVLVALEGLSRDHANPHYGTDQGMLDAYLGSKTTPTLRRLLGEGMIRRSAPLSPDGRENRWELTTKGRARAIDPDGDRT